eukprot:6860703-Pyramimonas_sp.AAC.1
MQPFTSQVTPPPDCNYVVLGGPSGASCEKCDDASRPVQPGTASPRRSSAAEGSSCHLCQVLLDAPGSGCTGSWSGRSSGTPFSAGL